MATLDPTYNASGVSPTMTSFANGVQVPTTPSTSTSPVSTISTTQGVSTLNKTQDKYNILSGNNLASTFNLPQDQANKVATDIQNLPKDTATGQTTTPPTKVTLINPATGQNISFDSPDSNRDTIQQYMNAGYQFAEGSGTIPTWLTPSGVTQMSQAESDLTSAKAQVNTAIESLKNLDVSQDPALQAMLTGITSQWNTRIAEMEQANASQIANTTSLGFRLGAQFAGGNGGTFGTIISAQEQAGIQKVAGLEAEKQNALVQAQVAYRNQKFDEYYKYVELADKKYNESLDEVKNLQDVQQKQQDYIQKVQDFNYKKTQDTVANDQKQQQIEQDAEKLKQGQYEFKDARDEFGNIVGTTVYDKATGKPISLMAGSSSGSSSGGGSSSAFLNPVPVTSSGVPDTSAQAKYLASLPASIATIVQDLANYKINPLSVSKKGNTQATLIARATQYDPTYDPKEYNARAAFIKSWDGVNNVRVPLNTAIAHLGELKKANDSLADAFTNNAGIFSKSYNNIAGWVLDHKQDPRAIAFNEAANKVADELAKAYKGGNASATDVGQEKERILLSLTSAPVVKDGAVQEAVNLLGDYVKSYEENYQAVMGKPPGAKDGVIFDNAEQSLKDMQKAGLNIDISKFGVKSDTANAVSNALQGGHSAKDVVDYLSKDSNYSDKISQARAQGISDEDIASYLQNQ